MAKLIILMQKTRMGGMLLDSEMGLWGLNKENGLWVEGAFYCCENTKAGSQCRYCTKIALSSCFSPFSYLYLIGLSRPQAPFSTCITIFSFSSPPWLLVMTFDTCTLLSPCNLGPHSQATKTLYKFTTRCYEGPFLVGLPAAWVWAWLCTYSEIGGHLLEGVHPPPHHSLSLEMCYIASLICVCILKQGAAVQSASSNLAPSRFSATWGCARRHPVGSISRLVSKIKTSLLWWRWGNRIKEFGS